MAIGTAAALIGSAVIGGVAANSAASKASKAQESASNSADEISQRQFDRVRADNAPTRAIGDASRNQLAMLMGLDVPQARQGGGSTSMYGQQPAQAPAQAGGNAGYAGGGQWFPNGQDVPTDRGVPTRSYWSDGDFYAEWPATQGMNALAPMAQQMPDKQIPESMNNYGPNNPLFGSMTKPFTAGDLANDPGYQFQREQGTQGIERNALGRSGLYSGATMKALSRFNQGLAATSFQDAFNRNQTQNDSMFNKYASLAGAGQVATNNVSSAGQQYANSAAENALGMGNARAGAALNAGNNIQNVINGSAQNWLRYNQQQSLPNSYANDPVFSRYTTGNFGSGD